MGIGQVSVADADRVDNFLHRQAIELRPEAVRCHLNKFACVDTVSNPVELAMCQNQAIRPGKERVGVIVIRQNRGYPALHKLVVIRCQSIDTAFRQSAGQGARDCQPLGLMTTGCFRQ